MEEKAADQQDSSVSQEQFSSVSPHRRDIITLMMMMMMVSFHILSFTFGLNHSKVCKVDVSGLGLGVV